MEFEHEEEQKHEQELKNLQVLEWLHDLQADTKKTILKIEDVDQSSIKYINHDNTESIWIAPDCPLRSRIQPLGTVFRRVRYYQKKQKQAHAMEMLGHFWSRPGS